LWLNKKACFEFDGCWLSFAQGWVRKIEKRQQRGKIVKLLTIGLMVSMPAKSSNFCNRLRVAEPTVAQSYKKIPT
jgi:hypothetical protein